MLTAEGSINIMLRKQAILSEYQSDCLDLFKAQREDFVGPPPLKAYPAPAHGASTDEIFPKS